MLCCFFALADAVASSLLLPFLLARATAGYMLSFGKIIKDSSDPRAVPEHNLLALKTCVDNMKIHVDLALNNVRCRRTPHSAARCCGCCCRRRVSNLLFSSLA